MLFSRVSCLKISYTVANYPADDVDLEAWYNLGRPQTAYHTLKGSAADMDWPQGAFTFPFPDALGFGNQLLTDGGGHEYGIKFWSISAEPGKIPGKLTVASYHNDNGDDADPDNLQDFDLTTGSWDTGELPVFDTDGTQLWRYPLIRWVPINLISLL
ncbi:hypothetical protein [Prosthecobacter sp.]|jgi:hypothetical protein|uniref:hypothetical protein n=1 Tax=Prosthecobacter sp. TaxID=1965333 RepID=UPI0037C6479E